ncbi:MAG TPA: flagellar hook capping FlgD N-terminal domain-containing protein [Vicinamibacterales bacterium]|nr:flagellar hook capping FlgD N-terminal domain-containing protein [Vicinamibacterales bacterium]
MTVNQTPGATTNPTQSASAATTSANSSNALSNATKGLGENAFLQLLVTQLQNQDPLQPQDPTQFVAELAQFSSLDMLTQINTSVQGLGTQLSSPSSTASTPASTPSTPANSSTPSTTTPSTSSTPSTTGGTQ